MGTVFGKITVEQPKFRVVKRGTDGEIRQYRGGVAAETDCGPGSFMVLAGYIGVRGSPKNRAAKPVAMTAPVVEKAAATILSGRSRAALNAPVAVDGRPGGRVMQFILPSKYQTVAEAPVPTDKRVRLVQRPPRTCLAHRASGSWNKSAAKKKADELAGDARKLGYLPVYRENGDLDWEWYRYNPPLTISWLRTTDVVVFVERLTGEGPVLNPGFTRGVSSTVSL